VVGQVQDPGLHTIYASYQLSELLKLAGGILPGGSIRNVHIKRRQDVIAVDLYEVFRQGKVDNDLVLEPGDVIEVPLAGDKVTIMGEIARPGAYELKKGEKLKDLLLMAGSSGSNSSLGKVIYLKRRTGTDQFDNYKLDLYKLASGNDESQNLELRAGDIVSIPAVESFVYVQGDIGKAGRFDYVPGKKLSDYLNYAGGPLAKANLGNVTVVRQIEGKTEVLKVNAYDILKMGVADKDIEIMAGDVINVPGNFFYVNDFLGFSNIVMTAVALYNVLIR
jgi:protein involved in polysaccharide export with SLBB domain